MAWITNSIGSPVGAHHAHSSIKPSDSEPGPWVQASSVTKNSPSTLKTESASSPCSTFSAAPGTTSEVLHNSIFSAIDLAPSAQPDQWPVEWHQQEEDHKLDHGEPGPHAYEIARGEVPVRVPDDQHARLIREKLAAGGKGPDHAELQRVHALRLGEFHHQRDGG